MKDEYKSVKEIMPCDPTDLTIKPYILPCTLEKLEREEAAARLLIHSQSPFMYLMPFLSIKQFLKKRPGLCRLHSPGLVLFVRKGLEHKSVVVFYHKNSAPPFTDEPRNPILITYPRNHLHSVIVIIYKFIFQHLTTFDFV